MVLKQKVYEEFFHYNNKNRTKSFSLLSDQKSATKAQESEILQSLSQEDLIILHSQNPHLSGQKQIS